VYFRGNIDAGPEECLLFTNFPHSQPGGLIHLYGTY
jgi:hypothetical protein